MKDLVLSVTFVIVLIIVTVCTCYYVVEKRAKDKPDLKNNTNSNIIYVSN